MRDRLIVIFGLLIGFLLVGGAVYHNLEGWSYLDSVYFTAMTITTVGYGDFVPTTPESKVFTIIFSMSGISLVLFALLTLGRQYETRLLRRVREAIKRGKSK